MHFSISRNVLVTSTLQGLGFPLDQNAVFDIWFAFGLVLKFTPRFISLASLLDTDHNYCSLLFFSTTTNHKKKFHLLKSIKIRHTYRLTLGKQHNQTTWKSIERGLIYGPYNNPYPAKSTFTLEFVYTLATLHPSFCTFEDKFSDYFLASIFS